MSDLRRRARVRITAELLTDVLCLPPGTLILGASIPVDQANRDPRSFGCSGRDIELMVSHPDLKEAPPMDLTPEARPMWRRQEPVVFDGWGQG